MRHIKKVGAVIATALLVIIAALVLAVQIIPQARGGAGLIIETGSMRPTINPGDVVAVKPVEVSELQIGDIITYATADKLITHRIIGFVGAGKDLQVITQGDANNAEDAPVYPAQVRGRVQYTIPRVGFLLPWLGEHVFWIIGGAAMFWLLSWGYENFRKLQVEKQAKQPGGQPAQTLEPATGGALTQFAPNATPSRSADLNQIATTLPAFLGAPSATLVRTRTAVTAFSEPIEISAEKSEAGQHLPPVTVVRTPTLTAAYNEPITVTAAIDGNLNLVGATNGAKAVRVTDIRFSKQQLTYEELDDATLTALDPPLIPVEIAA